MKKRKAMEWILRARWPMVRNTHIKKWFRICSSSIGEFGGSRMNTQYTLFIFGWAILSIHRNEYHDRSDAERAQEYLKKWSAHEKRMRKAEAILYGRTLDPETKKIIKDALGVDFDEGESL